MTQFHAFAQPATFCDASRIGAPALIISFCASFLPPAEHVAGADAQFPHVDRMASVPASPIPFSGLIQLYLPPAARARVENKRSKSVLGGHAAFGSVDVLRYQLHQSCPH